MIFWVNENDMTTVTTSDNTALIPHPTVNYSSPNSTGSLACLPIANQYGSALITVTVRDAGRLAEAGRVLGPVGVGEPVLDEHRRSVLVPTAGGSAVLTDALRRLDAAGVEIDDVGLRRPTLDDVFLTLTGRLSILRGRAHPQFST